MTIIRLPNEGDTHTAKVKSCESVQGTYGQQVKFEFADGDLLFMPYDSAVRQLLRSGFDDGQDENGEDQVDFAAVAGETLTFARTHNKKPGAKPFWDVSVANGAEKAGAAPSKRLSAPPTASEPPAHHRESGVPSEPPRDRLDEAMDEAGLQDESAALRVEFSEKQEAVIGGYLRLYERVAGELCRIGKAQDFPVDGTSINAATATISISLDKRNLAL